MNTETEVSVLPIEDRQPGRQIAPVTPSDLLRIAVEQGADLDKLERLMDLQDRYNEAEARRAYNSAFAAFKAEDIKINKNAIVKQGPLSGRRYAELSSVVKAVTPALSRHGLSASWKTTKDEKDWIEVTCILKHVAGHFESVAMGGQPDTGGAKNALQARASTQSYLQRYTLKSICGVAEIGDDDDGQSAVGYDAESALSRVEACQSKSELDALQRKEWEDAKKHKAPKAYRVIVEAIKARAAELEKSND